MMIKSMTAYGRASGSSPLGKIVVEMQSLNRKMLDISSTLPKDFLRFDSDVRKILSQTLERGQISVRVSLQQDEKAPGASLPSLSQFKKYKQALEEIAEALGYDSKAVVDFPFLTKQMLLLKPEESACDEGAVLKAFLPLVEGALQELVKMKQVEGSALEHDLRMRLSSIEKKLQEIAAKGQEPLNRYRQRLLDRIREVAEIQEVDTRILHEVAIYTERLDITEEQVRLRSHLHQFRQHLESKEKSVGRTLDFLTQEMQRESNTISAKSADTEIASLIVMVKAELEKIREQVQNIE